jgi:hypothetical protein
LSWAEIARDIHGMILGAMVGWPLKAQVATLLDRQSRTLLKLLAGASERRHAGGSVGVLPRTRRRSVHDSRNLSRAPAASLVIGFAAP